MFLVPLIPGGQCPAIRTVDGDRNTITLQRVEHRRQSNGSVRFNGGGRAEGGAQRERQGERPPPGLRSRGHDRTVVMLAEAVDRVAATPGLTSSVNTDGPASRAKWKRR